jgi:hypothetical protein
MTKTRQLAEILSDSLDRREQNRRQNIVYNFMLRNSESIRRPNFEQLSSSDLGLLFHVTDEQFFHGKLGQACETTARPLKFRLSRRMTTSGGMTTMQQVAENVRDFEIAVATTPLFQSFQQNEPSRVGGRACQNRLQALQRIMEHEMVHLAEMLIWNDSNCSAKRFKSISRRFFGHTESNHQLLTPRDIAKTKYKINAGDRVAFHLNGRKMNGLVNRITKRATVLVVDSRGTLYTDGKRYLKFYVPINQLQKVA